MDDRAFLGRGWHFPVCADETSGRVKTCDYEDDIEQAVKLILLTRRGERIMRPDFGSLLHTYSFEDMSLGAMHAMTEEVKNSLIRWEPRIENIQAEISQGDSRDGCVMISVSYTVRATNSPFNLVFPFYLSEGTAEGGVL